MEPLVYTTKGNLPISTLEYFHFWEDSIDFIKFTEGYRMDGEEVKRAVHILLKKGQDLSAEQASL